MKLSEEIAKYQRELSRGRFVTADEVYALADLILAVALQVESQGAA